MKIIIDIHEKDLECLKRTGQVTYALVSGVLNGTLLPKEHGWILVSEKLPERCKEVIVTDIETSDTYLSRYIGNRYWECDNGLFKNRIIAWMPLPEPYREGESE